jgi:hypothetical protein
MIGNLIAARWCVYTPRRFGSIASDVVALFALSSRISSPKDPRILELDSHYQF